MILIKNGRIIDPKTGQKDAKYILVKDGVIEKIGDNIEKDIVDCCEIIDAKGNIIAPALIDIHVHFRDPGLTHKEDIVTGANCAKAGGFAQVVCMANTKPTVDNEETLKYVLNKGKETGIKVHSVSAITKDLAGKELIDFPKLVESGAIGASDDGFPIKNSGVMYEAMKIAKKNNIVLSLHEEDPNLIGVAGINDGKIAKTMEIEGAKSLAEEVMISRDCLMAIETGARINLQHLSSKKTIEMLRMFKKMGGDIWAEATPQHFSITEEKILEKGANAKLNPPLRSEEDRLEIIEGLKDGTIDIIATDHAPHIEEEKSGDITKAPSGLIGLETALALGITNLVKEGHLTIEELLEKMSLNPAKLYGIEGGSLEIGKPADIVIFDENKKWVVKEFCSKSNNSPFVGETLYGVINYTIVDGKIVFERKEEVVE